MSAKEIIFSPNAEREIKKLTKANQKVVWGYLEKMRQGEGKLEIEKIKTQPDFFRLRAAHMRIIYYPFSAGRVVLLSIRDRKTAYRNLGDLGAKLDSAFKKLKIASK